MKEILSSKENVPFTQIANNVLNDRALSWKAKGLFSYLYSKPQDWDFSGFRISDDSKDGRDSTFAGLKELEEAGYLTRKRNADGTVAYAVSWRKPHTANPDVASTKALSGKSLIRETRIVSNKEGETNKEDTNKKTATQSIARPDSFFQKKMLKDDGALMDVSAFILMCRASQWRHIRLIGEYADERKPDFTTRGQWRGFGLRNMRAARLLAPYTDRQIEGAFKEVMKDTKDRGGFISKWTLETIVKYLDQSSY